MELKKQIFADLEERTRPDTLLATNTSALSVTEISRGLQHPERVAGLHFLISASNETGRDRSSRGDLRWTIDTAVAFVQRVGKLPVVVRDRPGFLVNRILLPYLIEAGRLFEAGADVRLLDESMLDFGMPMGPLRLLDEVGLDVASDVAQSLCAAFPSRMQVRDFREIPREGNQGPQGGARFYDYRNGHQSKVNSSVLRLASGKATPSSPKKSFKPYGSSYDQ